MIRGFSFYHPRRSDPTPHLGAAADQLTAIVDKCQGGCGGALEVECQPDRPERTADGRPGSRRPPSLVCIFDGGNISSQVPDAVRCFAEYEAMEALGICIKDYRIDAAEGRESWTRTAQEFVPADQETAGTKPSSATAGQPADDQCA
jgi:hypothetical protein